MLITIFGFWVMLSNINHLEEYGTNCTIVMNAVADYATRYSVKNQPCSVVAAEINKQIKGGE